MPMLKLLRMVAAGMNYVANAALVALVAVTTLDVLGRNLGLFTVPGVVDWSRLFMLVAGGFSLAVAFFEGRHLVVEIGTQGLSEKAKARLEAVWLLLGGVPLAVMAYLVFVEGLELHERGQIIGVLGWSPVLFHSLTSVALGAATVTCVVMGGRKLAGIAGDLG